MKKKNVLFPLLTLTTLLFVGCAKEKPYDVEYKEVELLSRSNILIEETVQLKDGTSVTRPIEYLYVPMTLGTPMNVTDADPFYQGQEKIVRLAWSKEGLEVLQIEKDGRFQDNELNEYPVLTIPGKYKDFKCREDAYGDCTNVEEEDNEKEWYEKKSFLPEFEKLEVREVNELNIFTLNNGSCLSEEGNKVVDYELKAGVINIELETSYKVNSSNFFCFFRSFFDDQLQTNGFRVRKFYSLVRLKDLASPDYEAVNYPDEDHNKFGFFNREELVLNNDYDRRRKEKNILMERWNPKRKNNELVYFLSPEYSKEENRFILDATYEAINTMNNEMAASNVPFKIKLIEQPDPKTAVSPGDLRYNSLVLIEDPLANGLLGYGPAVSNPYTGEIVKAHTNMYLGVLKGMTRHVYESAVDITEDRYRKANPPGPGLNSPVLADIGVLSNLPEGLQVIYSEVQFQRRMTLLENERARRLQGETQPQDEEEEEEGQVGDNDDDQGENQDKDKKNSPAKVTEILNAVPIQRIKDRNNLKRIAIPHFDRQHIEHAFKERSQTRTEKRAAEKLIELKEAGLLTKEQELELKEEARLDRYAENNALATEFFPIGGTSKVIYPELLAISGIQTFRGTLKRWDELSSAQKEAAQKIIVKSSYIATLIHELGHNLGLRHNFMGSWDKENFYTDEEAREMGMEAAPAYSSIMDYSFSEFNQLKALGKYDLAALRFAYAREVEVEEAVQGSEGEEVSVTKIVPVKGTLASLEQSLPGNQSLKNYEFCTDENAGLSTNCNRFDEGTTLEEITKHLIKRYEEGYKYRNFRDGRHEFSAYDLPSYIRARKREFTRIRDVIEDYEFFVELFGKDIMATGCNPEAEKTNIVCRWIRDRINAVELAGNFFLDVLSTPDHLCAVVTIENPDLIIDYLKLGEIYEENKSRFSKVPKSCFDNEVQNILRDPRPSAKDPEPKPLYAVGEAGKFLNGFKDTDPKFRYVTDRYVIGTWPDKVMAVKALYMRKWGKSNTDRAHMSLLDIPEFREKAESYLSHYIMGTPLPDGATFTLDDGRKHKLPYAIADDYTINPLEDAFSYMRKGLGLPEEGGKGTLIGAALSQIDRKVDYGVEFEEASWNVANSFSVIKEDGYVPESDLHPNEVSYYDRFSRMTYISNKDGRTASFLIQAINAWNGVFKEADIHLSYKVFKQRGERPTAPADVTGDDRLFWENVQDGELSQLIMIAEEGASLNVGAINQFFSRVEGLPQAVLSVYDKGANHMKAMRDRMAILKETPPKDATDLEKELYKVPRLVLNWYSLGVLTDESVNHFVDQLRRLPNFSKAIGR